jgi:hypothetical protein
MHAKAAGLKLLLHFSFLLQLAFAHLLLPLAKSRPSLCILGLDLLRSDKNSKVRQQKCLKLHGGIQR